MRNKIIAAISFLLLLGSVVIVRFNPTLIDFNNIHNIYGPNVLYRDFFEPLPLYIGLFSIGLTLLLGPVFCGYVCPFGTFQRILHFIGRKIGFNKKLPIRIHEILSSIKYIVLTVFVFLIVSKQVMIYINIDPYHGFIRLFYGGITLMAGLYLIIIILLSLYIKRPFCNYLCPYGAGLNLISSIRILRVTRHDEHCIQCKACDHVCPVRIQITPKETVNNVNCLSCHDCIKVCPRKKAINLKPKLMSTIAAVTLMVVLTQIISVKTLPVIADVEVPVVETEVVETPVEIKDEPLKETSTIDVYYHSNIDLLPVGLADEKQAEITVLLQLEAERLAKEEAERLKREEADRLAREEAARKAQEEADKLAEQKAQEEASTGLYKDGVYRARVNAFAPDMVVQVEIKDDKIISVEVVEHNETMSYFNFSAEKMYKKIVENNSTDVMVVAGCTYTSRGIKNGVNACLNQAKK